VFTGAILALARAFGETAPLLLVGAVTGYLSAGGSGNVIETLQGRYTSLPTIIFSWSRQAGEEWRQLTAAAIVVLLAVILVVNLAAILLRNRYERKW
jgi:phosphate transport system permease protein